MNTKYIPKQKDIVWIDFEPSAGKEIRKRRPAVVVSSDNYSKQTGFVAVCPITHGQRRLKEQNLLVEVDSPEVDGYVNPLQLHTFDFTSRHAVKITEMDEYSFAQVVQLYNFIFEDT